MAFAPEPMMPEMLDPEAVKTTEDRLALVMRQKLLAAQALSDATKRKWSMWIMMRHHGGLQDDPTHPLTELGLYIASLGKYVQTMKANMLRSVLPSAADMDFFALKAKWMGLEDTAEKWEALQREKFKSMSPTAASSFQGVTDMLMDDLLTIGNCVALPKYAFEDESPTPVLSPQVQHGPVIEWLDPFNCSPDSVTVNSAAQANWFVYDPITREELEDAANGFVNVERVVEEVPETDVSVRERNTGDEEIGEDREKTEWESDFLGYERHIYLGRFPWAQMRMAGDVDKAAVMEELAAVYGFDPAAGGQYWWIEFIGNIVTVCKPYPYWLPRGVGPIEHHGLIRRNGFLWANGMYDLAGAEERIMNAHHRDVVTIARLAARPPKWFDRSKVDQDFLTGPGDTMPAVAPDQSIPCTNTDGKPPWGYADVREGVIKLLRGEISAHESSMRELTGATTAVEGTDQSDTATQANNNLQQSQMLVEYFSMAYESGPMRQMVRRTLVMMMQAIYETQSAEIVPVSYDEMTLQMMEVRPEHVVDMALIDVQMLGTSNPGNKMGQFSAIMQLMQMFLPTGMISVYDAFKLLCKVLGVRGAEQLLAMKDIDDQQKMMFNQIAALGIKGVAGLGAGMGATGGPTGGAAGPSGMPGGMTPGGAPAAEGMNG
ncbi:MAG: hypothetical protein ABFD89_04775 [Bryobacteraceae bacterium]